MNTIQAIENDVLEHLTAGHTVADLINAGISMLGEAVDTLLTRVFLRDDYAVKYAVEPLLNRDGPLGDLALRCKLLYGLGVLSRADYQDSEQLLTFAAQLSQSNHTVNFTDAAVLNALSALHCITELPPLPPCTLQHDPAFRRLHQQRQQQIVRSSAVLALTGLLTRIHASQAFNRDHQ